MAGSSRYSRAIAGEVGQIEKHLRSLEKTLEKIQAGASTGAKDQLENLGDVVASALTGWADRFRQSAASLGNRSTTLSKDAMKAGTTAVDRLSREAGNRPFLVIAVALGVGILIGLSRRGWD